MLNSTPVSSGNIARKERIANRTDYSSRCYNQNLPNSSNRPKNTCLTIDSNNSMSTISFDNMDDGQNNQDISITNSWLSGQKYIGNKSGMVSVVTELHYNIMSGRT